MASLGHIAVGMAVARIADGRIGARSAHPVRDMALWALLALAPDADAIGFLLGVPYADAWGHRGATHSLAFAIAGGVLALLLAPRLHFRRAPFALLVTLTLASHGVLDMMTTGGLGVAWWSPVSLDRLFLPWRPIPVAPIGLSFLSRRGLYCAAVELALFFPLWLGALVSLRRR